MTGITPVTIAPVNYLDAYGQTKLNKTIFDVVGYGTEVRKPESGPQKPQPMSYPLIRRYTTSPGQKLTPQILQLNGNFNDTRSGGGTCFGDSGGPVFLNSTGTWSQLRARGTRLSRSTLSQRRPASGCGVGRGAA